MNLAYKLYKIGQLASQEEIKEIIEVTEFKKSDHRTIQVDFYNNKVAINLNAVDSRRTKFTQKIGGSGKGIFYLYPNFEYQKKDLYEMFKTQVLNTIKKSIMLYANDEHKKLAKSVLHYIQDYDKDILDLKGFEEGNYFFIVTIGGQTFFELMPEVLDNYLESMIDIFTRKINKKEYEQLLQIDPKKVYYEAAKSNKKEYYEILFQDSLDFITHEKIRCGYNPDIKFFTMDNYDDALKPQIINKLPMSKETAKSIKKGWMYAINRLKFNHKGLEYIVIPSMVNFDDKVYKELLRLLKKSSKIDSVASREDSFMRRLSQHIEEFDKDKISGISLDILFTKVDTTNLSVKIFATLEDVLPSRIRNVVKTMQDMKIVDSLKRETNSQKTLLREYFSRDELLAIAIKKTASMKNRIIQEKIYLAKLLLGYAKIDYVDLLKRFEFDREFDYEHKKRLSKEGIKSWIEHPNSFVSQENKIIDFLESIEAIKNRR